MIATAMEEQLWRWAERFSNHFSADEYSELLEVKSALQSPLSAARRQQALVFSMYQLLINGAIAEHNIHVYGSNFPDFVHLRLNDDILDEAVVSAWKGVAYIPARSNILGSIAFMVVLLFFFEACCRMQLNDDDSSLKIMLDKLKGKGSIDQYAYGALTYLAELRNVWHNFGLHKPTKKECSYHSANAALIFPRLIPGQTTEPLGEGEKMHLVDQVLETFCKLTNV
ncbi:MAG: hypothetical protein ACREQE_06160 [Candidatus Binataceae bacterium]